jgi:hypothetical protein
LESRLGADRDLPLPMWERLPRRDLPLPASPDGITAAWRDTIAGSHIQAEWDGLPMWERLPCCLESRLGADRDLPLPMWERLPCRDLFLPASPDGITAAWRDTIAGSHIQAEWDGLPMWERLPRRDLWLGIIDD